MRIDLNGTNPDPLVNQRGHQSSGTASDPVVSPGEDTTSLSSTADNIKTLTSQAMESSGIRQDKVEALRQAIASGQYKVDPGKVADSILEESSSQKFPS